MNNNFLKKQFFTLIELIVSMAVFSTLMIVVITAFNSAQTSTSSSYDKSMMFENSKIAMDLISRDIQSIYYVNGSTPFWNCTPTDSNELLAFVASTSVKANQYCTAAESEVKYQLYYTESSNDGNAGWIMRSVTGNITNDSTPDSLISNAKWNYQGNLTAGLSGAGNAFTEDNDSSDHYEKLVPYVTELIFKCYPKNGPSYSGVIDEVTAFPYSINVSISMLGRNAWKKWLTLNGDAANKYLAEHEQTFNKTIFIGDRGQ